MEVISYGKSMRNSSIELLRILLGFGVMILHFNFFPSGGGAIESTKGLTKEILLILEVLFGCSVNTFILISGYFGFESTKINFPRIIKLILQTISFQLVFALESCVKLGDFSITSICRALLPVNYYVILYSALMLIAPYINKLMNSLKGKTLKVFTLVSFLVFSVYPTFVDILKEVSGKTFNGLSSIGLSGSDAGYTIVNFILVYIIGCYLKITTNQEERQSAKKLTLILLGCLFVLFIWRKIIPNTALIYCNPFLIIEGVCILSLFAKLNMKSKAINIFAPSSFSCFLICDYFLGYFGFEWLTGKNLFEVMGIMLVEVIGIYLISFIAMIIWTFVTKPVFYHTVDRIPIYQLEK